METIFCKTAQGLADILGYGAVSHVMGDKMGENERGWSGASPREGLAIPMDYFIGLLKNTVKESQGRAAVMGNRSGCLDGHFEGAGADSEMLTWTALMQSFLFECQRRHCFFAGKIVY